VPQNDTFGDTFIGGSARTAANSGNRQCLVQQAFTAPRWDA
jgi:hypothetical protein